MLTAATLFTGIGAPEYASASLGLPINWIYGAEIDRGAKAVMQNRFPQIPNLGDVNEKNFVKKTRAIGSPDLIVFGSPCQSFSVAGARGGLDDPRGDLTLRALSIVHEIQPEWFLWENVPGVLSNGFGTIINKISECGYNGAWRVFDAQFFGIPQRRRRLFFLGHRGSGRQSAKILFERHRSTRDKATRRKKRQDSTDQLYEYHGQDTRLKKLAHIVPTLPRKMGTGNLPIVQQQLYERQYDSAIIKTKGEKITPILTQGKTDKGDAMFIYQVLGHDGVRQVKNNKLSTLQAGGRKGRGGSYLIDQDAVLRWLTPDEAEACQGFPKGWTDCISQSARYRVVGNSMAVPVVGWILNRLINAPGEG